MSVAAFAQDPLKTLPNNYRLSFENEAVTVIRAHYGAHEKIAVHDHPGVATVFIYLNKSGPVRIDHAEKGEISAVRPPTVAGSYRIAPALAERHSIESLSETDSDFIRVEMKHVTLGVKEPFRGKAPADLLHNLDVIEFTDPAVQIERIVCVGMLPCKIKSSEDSSLLIALDPVVMTESPAKPVPLAMGDVSWLPAKKETIVTPGSGSTVHLLRILLPDR